MIKYFNKYGEEIKVYYDINRPDKIFFSYKNKKYICEETIIGNRLFKDISNIISVDCKVELFNITNKKTEKYEIKQPVIKYEPIRMGGSYYGNRLRKTETIDYVQQDETEYRFLNSQSPLGKLLVNEKLCVGDKFILNTPNGEEISYIIRDVKR